VRRWIPATLTILLALFVLARPALAQAPPSVPAARYYGSVTLGGYTAPGGTSLLAQGANGAYCGNTMVLPDGSYALDLQAGSTCAGTLTFFINGQQADQTAYVSNTFSGAVALNLSVSAYYGAYGPPQPPYSGFTGSVTYQPGWNLVGVPVGGLVSPSNGVLFTWQPGDAAYETLSSGGSLRAGYGYWAYFSSTTTVTLPSASRRSMQRSIAPGQIALVGNPFSGPATISGATSAYTYDPVRGYQQTTVLQPGQGAWVLSSSGVVVITAG
jgi:hypothetical protein